MEFSVEVPGEANPLSEQTIYNTLLSASSNDPQQVQTGTKQLQAWEAETGFYPLLQSIYVDRSLPLEVRYLAIIQLKNGIDRHWRRGATTATGAKDKALIRARLLDSVIDEADRNLLLQGALVIGKVARFEFPNDWPDVISNLVEFLRTSSQSSSNDMRLPRALIILLFVVKELLTARLQRQRANLLAITPEVFHVLGQIYITKAQRWQEFIRRGGDDEAGALEDIEQSLLALRVIRRLIVAGFTRPEKDREVQQFWDITKSQLGSILEILAEAPLSSTVKELIGKNIVQIGKLHFNMATSHPISFILLPDTLNIVRSYWGLINGFGEKFGIKVPELGAKVGTDGDAEDEGPSPEERLSLFGLRILRRCVKMAYDRHHAFSLRLKDDQDETAQCSEVLKTELLTEDFVRQMMETIVTRFFVFRYSDLRQWEEEPDEWERMEDGESEDYEFAVRPCAEKLFLDLSIHFKTLLTEPLLNVFYSIASPDNENVFFKDSVYTAMGLAAPVIHDLVDFDGFITSTLAIEVQKERPYYNILRRRIAILLAQWISIKVSAQNRPVVYQIFDFLLDRSNSLNDQVVRVTAGRRFKDVVDAWEFDPQQFKPFAPTILERVMNLIGEAELSETKMALLNTISVIVERLDRDITPFAERIVSILPALWDQSCQEHLMKQSILTLLSRLMTSMKEESGQFHSICLPIIQGAVNPESETHLYLLEDALELWHSIVIHTASSFPQSPSPEVLKIAPLLVPTLDLGVDALRKALEITDSYLLLSPQTLLAEDLRQPLVRVFSSLLGNLRPDANGAVTYTVAGFIRSASEVGGLDGARQLVGEMVHAGFMTKVVEGLRGAWLAHQRTGPRSLEHVSPVDGVVETDYFSILARIAWIDPGTMINAVRTAAPTNDVNDVLKWLLEEWFSHFENIGHPDQKKRMALALTKLLETEQSFMLEKLQDLMTMWTDLVIELTEGQENPTVDTLVWHDDADDLTSSHYQSPEDRRVSKVSYADPVHTVNMIDFIRIQLQRAIEACGGQAVFQNEWLVNVDKDVIESFGRLGIL